MASTNTPILPVRLVGRVRLLGYQLDADDAFPMKPFPNSRCWIEAPRASVTNDPATAALVVRLALAVNALRSQQRYSLLIGDEPESAAAKCDRVLSFIIAAAFTSEAVNILTGTGKVPGESRAVAALAKKADVPSSLEATVAQLMAGTHPASRLLTRVRNQLTFHWDPGVVGESLAGFQKDEPLVWSEGRRPMKGSSIYRLAADVLSNALVLNREEMTQGQEETAEMEVLTRATEAIVTAMDAVSDYFDHAIAGYLHPYATSRAVDERQL